MIVKQLFPISAAGDKRAGIGIFPDDFDTNPELCPLIFFFHGVGQAGDGTLGPVDKLYDNGSPLAQARDGYLKTITCPITGKIYRPVIWGLQGVGAGTPYPWCVYPAQAIYALTEFLKAYSKIDPSMVMITGLSAGGQSTWELLGGPSASLFLAGWPMSTPAINTSAVNWTAEKAKIWATHGKLDGGQTAYTNSVNYVNAVNAVKPGQAFLTLTDDGHGGWDKLYTPSFRIVMPGVAGGKPINGYEFLLACKNSQFQFTASGTETGGTNTNPVSVTKAVASFGVVGNTVTLDGTGSTGAGRIQSSGWRFTDTAGNYVKPASIISGQMDAGPGVIPSVVVTMPNGTYILTLSVQGSDGSMDKAVNTVIVGSPAPTPTPSPTKTVKSVLTDTVNGTIICTISYSDGTQQVIK